MPEECSTDTSAFTIVPTATWGSSRKKGRVTQDEACLIRCPLVLPSKQLAAMLAPCSNITGMLQTMSASMIQYDPGASHIP